MKIKGLKKAIGFLCAALLFTGGLAKVVPVRADALRVVTLGADLSDEQKQTMLRYFKVNASEVRILYVTNQDERNMLGSLVPLEQIGTRTVSCAYVRPTTSGGIKVRTANLNYVTAKMISSAMSTSGVSNCEIIAACPFEVSGTGALTGVMMAYETASGEKLDDRKKEIATEEMVVTGRIADNVGRDQAVNVINQSKIEVIGNNIQDAEQINNVVNNIVNNNGLQLSQEQITQIVELLEQMAAEDYDYQDMEETLSMIDENIAEAASDETEDKENEKEDAGGSSEEVEDNIAEEAEEDSIFFELDEDVLGDDVVTSTTDVSAVEEVSSDEFDSDDEGWEIIDLGGGDTNTAEPASSDLPGDGSGSGDDMGSDIDGWFGPDDTDDNWFEEDGAIKDDDSDSSEEGWAEDGFDVAGQAGPDDNDPAENAFDAELADISALSTGDQDLYEDAYQFCKAVYEADAEAIQDASFVYDALAAVKLDAKTGKALTNKVMKEYLNILKNGETSYQPSLGDVYTSTDMNLVKAALEKIFMIDGNSSDAEAGKILSSVSSTDRKTLYQQTLDFFEGLYGESDLLEMMPESGEADDTLYEDPSAESGNVSDTDSSMDGDIEDFELDNVEDSYDDFSIEDTGDDFAEDGWEEDGDWEEF